MFPFPRLKFFIRAVGSSGVMTADADGVPDGCDPDTCPS
jgi:hypothetical protein